MNTYDTILKESHTYHEILKQPTIWKEASSICISLEKEFENFLRNIQKRTNKLVVLFVGAGTSEFVGNIAREYFAFEKSIFSEYNIDVYFESYGTTDILTAVPIYQCPVLVVSYARSGNSPESVATIEKIEQKNKEVYNFILTCNPNGKLAENFSNHDNAFVLQIPSANDKGFAMTASFSSMLLATYIMLSTQKGRQNIFTTLENVIDTSRWMIQQDKIKKLVEIEFDRIAYLGSNVLSKMCQEAALKILELTAGKVASWYNSPLGFRHGPKSLIHNKTLIVCFVSEDSYKQQYDADIIKEIRLDKISYIMPIVPYENKKISDPFLQLPHDLPDYLAIFPYIVFAQLLALYKSCALELTPDNPFPSGTVNRVVQGVTVYN